VAATADKKMVKCFVCTYFERFFNSNIDIWSYATITVFIKATWMVVVKILVHCAYYLVQEHVPT